MVKYSTVNLHTAHMIGGCHASLNHGMQSD